MASQSGSDGIDPEHDPRAHLAWRSGGRAQATFLEEHRAEQSQFHRPAAADHEEESSDDDLDPVVVETFDNSAAAASDAVKVTVLH